MRILLIHGAATTGHVWRHVVAALCERPETRNDEVVVAWRGQSGDLDREIEALEELAHDSLVVGVSGGATLGLELSARNTGIRGAILHEPAAGSLAPGLLTHVAAALDADGLPGFGRALYGPGWTPGETTADLDTVRGEFAMFGAFEPRALVTDPDTILVTTGENSPAPRHAAARALRTELGVRTAVLSGVAHAVHLDAPDRFAAAIALHADSIR
jgi:pimeloyl-ACP methyl ester carboxylesterase